MEGQREAMDGPMGSSGANISNPQEASAPYANTGNAILWTGEAWAVLHRLTSPDRAAGPCGLATGRRTGASDGQPCANHLRLALTQRRHLTLADDLHQDFLQAVEKVWRPRTAASLPPTRAMPSAYLFALC